MQHSAKYEQIDFVARQLGKTPGEVVEAVSLADGGSGLPLVFLNVRVPRSEKTLRGKLVETSMLCRTAANLGVDPRELQRAILASRPGMPPGSTVGIGFRMKNIDRLFDRTGDEKMVLASRAAEAGDQWAREYLRLAGVVRALARRL